MATTGHHRSLASVDRTGKSAEATRSASVGSLISLSGAPERILYIGNVPLWLAGSAAGLRGLLNAAAGADDDGDDLVELMTQLPVAAGLEHARQFHITFRSAEAARRAAERLYRSQLDGNTLTVFLLRRAQPAATSKSPPPADSTASSVAASTPTPETPDSAPASSQPSAADSTSTTESNTQPATDLPSDSTVADSTTIDSLPSTIDSSTIDSSTRDSLPSTIDSTTIDSLPSTIDSTTIDSTTIDSTTIDSTTIDSLPSTTDSTTTDSTTTDSTTDSPPSHQVTDAQADPAAGGCLIA